MGWTQRVASNASAIAGGAGHAVQRLGGLVERNATGLIELVTAAARRGVIRREPIPDDPATAAYRDACAQAAQEIGRVNVLIAGNTGVGKSTLINAVFGADVAPVAAGMPVTQTLTVYHVPSAPLNLWDSRGFEAGDDEAVKAVDAKLTEMRRQGDAAAQIHIAWLCISSMARRVEPVHLSFLRQMKERQIPTIVVFTQTYRSLDHQVRSLARPAIAQVELLAADEPEFDRKAFGLDKLVEATDRALPEARKSAFAAAQKVAWALKKSEARRLVAATAIAAAGSAVIPGSSLLLTAAQLLMMAKIDRIFGRSVLSNDLSAYKTLAAAAAETGGKWLFGLLLSEQLKASVVGYAAGVAAGGAIAATFTGMIGYAYVETLDHFKGREVPAAELVEQLMRFMRATAR